VNDDILTLYYYKDGLSRAERQRVAHAIATEPDVARRYEAICRDLESLRQKLNETAERPPQDMLARWHDAIDRAAGASQPQPAARPFSPTSFFWGIAVAATLVVGIGIGVRLADNETAPDFVPPVAVTSPADDARAGRFARSLRVHLSDTNRELEALPATDGLARQALILDLIGQNRRYERAAELNDAENLARVLRAFELVLLRLAADDLPPEEAAALRSRLQFEMNAMLTKLADQPSNEPDTI